MLVYAWVTLVYNKIILTLINHKLYLGVLLDVGANFSRERLSRLGRTILYQIRAHRKKAFSALFDRASQPREEGRPAETEGGYSGQHYDWIYDHFKDTRHILRPDAVKTCQATVGDPGGTN